MGVFITVKCEVCNGTCKPGEGDIFPGYCRACGGTGEKLVWEANLGEAQGKLLQKQIDEAKL